MVATLARARGLSTSALGAAIGVHRNRMADKIAGRNPFKESEILALAELLGVPPARLFEDPLELLGVVSGGSSSACTRTAPAPARHLRLVA